MQRVLGESLVLDPPLEPERWTDQATGARLFRVQVPAGKLRLRYEGTVELTPGIDDPAAVREVPDGRIPLSALPWLQGSRFCPSDRVTGFAQKAFGHLPHGHARVTALCNWLREEVDYVAGASDAETTALDTLVQREGVCRDFAHLGITFCRALGIPARCISAYAWRLDPPDFHAVFEAWLEGPDGGGWYLFDATRMAAPQGLVRIGTGRDAADVPFCTPFGAYKAGKPEVWIRPADAADEPSTTQAVRAGG